MHLSFRRENCVHDIRVVRNAWTIARDTETLDRWKSFMDYDTWRDAYALALGPALVKWWMDRYGQILVCTLNELVLNFEDARGIDGAFLGIQLAEKLPPFRSGVVPDTLTIEAPTAALAESIRQIIIDTNAQERSE